MLEWPRGDGVGNSRAAVPINWFTSPDCFYLLIWSTSAAGGMRGCDSSGAKPPGLTWVGILLVPLTEQQHPGELMSQPQWGLTYPKSLGEASGRAGTHGLFVSYNATFCQSAPHFRRAACLAQTFHPLLALRGHLGMRLQQIPDLLQASLNPWNKTKEIHPPLPAWEVGLGKWVFPC